MKQLAAKYDAIKTEKVTTNILKCSRLCLKATDGHLQYTYLIAIEVSFILFQASLQRKSFHIKPYIFWKIYVLPPNSSYKFYWGVREMQKHYPHTLLCTVGILLTAVLCAQRPCFTTIDS